MASYRQLPEVFRRLHPRFKTPWLSLIVFAGVIPIAVLLPGKVDFLGTMYSFGAMLSFTIAHASIIAAAAQAGRSRVVPRPPEPADRRARHAALRRLRRPRHRDRLGRRRRPVPAGALGGPRLAGDRVRLLLACTAAASSTRPLRETVRAPVLVLGPSLTVEYRTIVVPGEAHRRERGGARRRRAARGRARRDRRDRPRDRGAARAPARREAARARRTRPRRCSTTRRRSSRATASARSRACSARGAPGRRSSRRPAAATPSSSFSARRAAPSRAGRRLFGGTVDYVLREAPCRVLVAAGKQSGMRRQRHRC